MNDTGEKILKKIKETHIKPKPRWEFLLKNYLMWAIFAIAILIGSLATAVMIFMLTHTDWQYYAQNFGIFKQLLINLPIFWSLILIGFLSLAFYNLKHTKQGYKYNPLLIVLMSIFLSIALGSGVYAIGGGEKLENIFYRRIPFYQQFMHYRGRLMLNPDRGIIAGVIIEINQDSIKIQDFANRIWTMPTSTDQFQVGQRVHLVGKKINEEQFEGQKIAPWFRPQWPIEPGEMPPPMMMKENFR